MKEYVLILGGPLEGEKPSPLLAERIKTGAAFLKAHPGARAVVSGGTKSEAQPLSEAAVMKKALLSLGVEEGRIILEEQALTTLQNFQYTKQLVEPDAQVTFVTNRFHIWRSCRICRKAGVSYQPLAAPNGAHSLGFRIREACLRPLAFFGIIW